MNGRPINAPLFLTFGLLAFAVAASIGLVVIAFTDGDSTLPGDYHWEGEQLDRDFASARRAADLGVQARLWVAGLDGNCRLILHVSGPPPAAIELKLVHGTRVDLDRDVRLLPSGDQAYEGHCGTVPAGLWHVELADESGRWSIQEDVQGALNGAQLSAMPPQTG